MDELPDSALHREVDLEIVKADAAGLLKSYIIFPSMIWGEATGQLFSKGFANSFGVLVPQFSKAAIKRGRAGVIGKGEYTLHSAIQCHIFQETSANNQVPTSGTTSTSPMLPSFTVSSTPVLFARTSATAETDTTLPARATSLTWQSTRLSVQRSSAPVSPRSRSRLP